MDKLQDFFTWIATLPVGAKLLISAAFILLAVAALILMWTPQKKTDSTKVLSDGLQSPQPQDSMKSPTPIPTDSSTPTATPKPMKTPSNVCPPVKTGDDLIDAAQAKLCDLQNDSPRLAETDVVQTLKPLFSRPAFYGIREENWEFFLFTLCRTRLLLEANVGYFNSESVRKKLGRVIELMVKLQNDVSRIYGPTFSITRHIASYINSRNDFTNHLPRPVSDPDYKFFENRDKTIKEIRAILKPLGLTDW